MTKKISKKAKYIIINEVEGNGFEVARSENGVFKVVAKGFETEKEAKDFIKAQKELGV